MPSARSLPLAAANVTMLTGLSELERAKWDQMVALYPSANRDLLWLYCSTWVDWSIGERRATACVRSGP